jgi:hypothetical protein
VKNLLREHPPDPAWAAEVAELQDVARLDEAEWDA